MNEGIFIPIAFFLMVAYIVKVLAEARVRRIAFEKAKAENLMPVAIESGDSTFSSLKWGLVLVGAGTAVLLGQLVSDESRGPVTLGLVLLFVGTALLISYRIGARQAEQAKTKEAAGPVQTPENPS